MAERSGFVVSVEGNIAAGKTFNLLNLPPYCDVVVEPGCAWTDINGVNILDKGLNHGWGFELLMTCAVGLASNIRASKKADVLYVERSPGTVRNVFKHFNLPMTSDSDDKKKLVDWACDKLPQPDMYIYLRVPVLECIQNCKKRRRTEEDSYGDTYLYMLEKAHDEWLMPMSTEKNWLGLPRCMVTSPLMFKTTIDKINDMYDKYLKNQQFPSIVSAEATQHGWSVFEYGDIRGYGF